MDIFFVGAFAALFSMVDCGKQCFACTYEQNAQKVGYECVTDPWNVTGQNTVLCTEEQSCVTRTVIVVATQEVYTIRRGCDIQNRGCRKDASTQHETCMDTCKDKDFCNNENKQPDNTNVTSNVDPVEDYVTCYSCVYSYHPSVNNTCLTDPENHARLIKCPKPKQCYVLGNWLTLADRWNSFARGCEDFSKQPKKCTVSAQFNDCLLTCCTDKCNIQNGKSGGEHQSCLPKEPNKPVKDNNGKANSLLYNKTLILVFLMIAIFCS